MERVSEKVWASEIVTDRLSILLANDWSDAAELSHYKVGIIMVSVNCAV